MALPKLYQAEWCGDSKKVREWATEHLVDYHLINVPRDKAQRQELFEATGQRSIPTLVDGDVVLADADQIIQHLATRAASAPAGATP